MIHIAMNVFTYPKFCYYSDICIDLEIISNKQCFITSVMSKKQIISKTARVSNIYLQQLLDDGPTQYL